MLRAVSEVLYRMNLRNIGSSHGISSRCKTGLWVLVLGLAVIPPAGLSHHSQSFFVKEFSELQGELVSVEWRNPHIRFMLQITEGDGAGELRRIETNSIYYLERAGLTKDRIQVGDHVKIGGYAAKKAGGDFLAAEIMLPDGDHFFLIRDGVTSQFKDVVVDTVADNKGIFRVWSIPQDNDRIVNRSLTESAIAKQATFDLLENFATRCEPAGMPRIMWYPHPYEFVDQGSKILLRTEMYDVVRTIHMDRSAPPENEPHSRLGYSVGRWDGEELIVNTTHINWEFFDTVGVPQSDAAEVIERFTLSEDQSRLDYHITTVDPETFTEPAIISGHWLALGEEIKPYECEIY